jgi:hypothetical protein
MKRWTWVLLLAAAGPGCVTVPEVKNVPPQPAPAEVEEAPRPRPRPVLPDQVTDENADEKLRQLQDEVERESHAPARLRR